MKRDYDESRQARQPYVEELYRLGFSYDQIAEFLPASNATVRTDIEALGGSAVFPDRPSGHAERFPRVMKRYAALFVELRLKAKTEEPVKARLCGFFGRWLAIDRIQSVLQGVDYAMTLLAEPNVPPKDRSYLNLVATMSGRRFPHSDLGYGHAYQFLRYDYLPGIATDAIPAPQSLQACIDDVLQRSAAIRREEMMPVWPKDVHVTIENALATLPSREELVLRRRCGIRGDSETLNKVAMSLGVTPERIRQIESRAFARLRNGEYGRLLEALVEPWPHVIARLRSVESERLETLKLFKQLQSPQQTPSSEEMTLLKTYGKRVDELGLTVRPVNCMGNADIKYVGELVQQTESGLLRTKNFGRKSLGEIKEALAKLDLHLDMKLPDHLVGLIQGLRTRTSR